MLAAAQIAALGLTVTAFWAAPLLAMTGVVVGLAPRLRALTTVLAAAASSLYLLGLGVYFKLGEWSADAVTGTDGVVAQAAASAVAATPEAQAARAAAAKLLRHAYAMVLGGDAHLVASLAVVFVAWPLCRTPLARRFAVVTPLLFFAVPGNPLLTDALTLATTKVVHWRVLWLLPVPLLSALVASAVLRAGRSVFGVLRVVIYALALTLLLQYASPRVALSKTPLERPRPKVNTGALALARTLLAHLPPHRQAAAPEKISRVLPMLNGYSYPLVIKAKYLPTSRADRTRRVRVTRLLSRPHPRNAHRSWVIGQLNDYRVEGVVCAAASDKPRGWGAALGQNGFTRVAKHHKHEVWVRHLPDPARARPP
jgi:hypothetical protein